MKLPESIDYILKRRYGIDYSILGKVVLEMLVRKRSEACGIDSDKAYFEKVLNSPEEMLLFMEGLLVPETWFFRDEELFRHLKIFINIKKKEKEKIRILCLPCATGEEAYSVLITLLEEGLSENDFKIIASDISKDFLKKAKTAIYKINSFRGTKLDSYLNYFDLVEENQHQIKPEFRKCIEFVEGNIVDPFLLSGEKPFDIILSRNVLIYFTENARKRAIETLYRLLKPKGLLFVGHADSITNSTEKFCPIGDSAAFAFCKKEDKPYFDTIFLSKKRPQYTQLKSTINPRSQDLAFANPQQSSNQLIALAKREFDLGNFDKAQNAIRNLLEGYGPDAEAYFLLGEIYYAEERKSDAEQAYKKTVTLDETHEAALSRLEALYENMGNFVEAKKIREQRKELKTNSHNE